MTLLVFYHNRQFLISTAKQNNKRHLSPVISILNYRKISNVEPDYYCTYYQHSDHYNRLVMYSTWGVHSFTQSFASQFSLSSDDFETNHFSLKTFCLCVTGIFSECLPSITSCWGLSYLKDLQCMFLLVFFGCFAFGYSYLLPKQYSLFLPPFDAFLGYFFFAVMYLVEDPRLLSFSSSSSSSES